jgi:predicted esterase
VSALDLHVHRWVPGESAEAPTLLLLHGTGGDENDLLSLGRMLLPGAALLSPRGNVLEHGAPRFFRRLAEGVFDEKDLRQRTGELGDFVNAAAERYGFARSRLFAVGYSNGANVAASLMLSRPDVLAGAVLFRAMVPFEPESPVALEGRPVLVSEGMHDQIIPVEGGERLAQLLREAGATVDLRWHPVGHQLTQGDVDAAREWLAERMRLPAL